MENLVKVYVKERKGDGFAEPEVMSYEDAMGRYDLTGEDPGFYEVGIDDLGGTVLHHRTGDALATNEVLVRKLEDADKPPWMNLDANIPYIAEGEIWPDFSPFPGNQRVVAFGHGYSGEEIPPAVTTRGGLREYVKSWEKQRGDKAKYVSFTIAPSEEEAQGILGAHPRGAGE